MNKLELKFLIKTIIKEEQNLHTGDVYSNNDFKRISSILMASCIKLQKLTRKFKIIEISSFDVVKGPYVTIQYINNQTFDKIWNLNTYGDLFIELKKWGGSVKELSAALNGNKNAIQKVLVQGNNDIVLVNV